MDGANIKIQLENLTNIWELGYYVDNDQLPNKYD